MTEAPVRRSLLRRHWLTIAIVIVGVGIIVYAMSRPLRGGRLSLAANSTYDSAENLEQSVARTGIQSFSRESLESLESSAGMTTGAVTGVPIGQSQVPIVSIQPCADGSACREVVFAAKDSKVAGGACWYARIVIGRGYLAGGVKPGVAYAKSTSARVCSASSAPRSGWTSTQPSP